MNDQSHDTPQATSTPGTGVGVADAGIKGGGIRSVARFVYSKPLGAIGGIIIVVFCIVAAAAPLLAPYDPLQIHTDRLLMPPGPEHLLGTDQFGRDILSRLIWGARISLFVGLVAVILGTTTGAILGLISGFFRGKVDMAIQRIMDVLMAFPMLVLALAMVAALGSSIQNVIIALAVVIMPNAARVIRSSALSVRERPFVEAAHNLGLSKWRILFRHVLPNCVAPYIVLATAAFGSAILTEASLSFLGLGTPPPSPSWGGMLSGRAQAYMVDAPWLAIFPGLAITIVVFGFNFFGDALRDAFDPRLRSR